MGTYLGRLCPHPGPGYRGGQHGAHFAHQLVPQRHPVVPAPPRCPNYLRIWQSWPVVAFLRLCVRIPWALCLFLGVLTSFCRRCHQRACGQRRVMPEQNEHPRVLEREAHQERGPEDRCHQQPQTSLGAPAAEGTQSPVPTAPLEASRQWGRGGSPPLATPGCPRGPQRQ